MDMFILNELIKYIFWMCFPGFVLVLYDSAHCLFNQ